MLATSTEKNTGPTPGPWHIREPQGSWEIHIDGPDGKYVCLLPTWTDIRTTQECEANATLVKNSPRLLKTALDLWHANAAEGPDRDELLIASAWAELIDAIEAADGTCKVTRQPPGELTGRAWADLQSETEAIDGDQVV